ncbi:MAG: DUF6174 domain-containing protein [Planctomycetota bacterium]|nr:DUF6174 domain-containing protein [Planctomycetota bacterium]
MPNRFLSTKILGWALFMIVMTCFILVWFFRQPSGPLTRENLKTAEQYWADHGPSNYFLELHLSGNQKGVHQVKVKNSQVTEMTTNGVTVAESVWKYWSVEGLFRQLRVELHNAQQPLKPYGLQNSDLVTLRVQFEKKWGFPRYFMRHVTGTPHHIQWNIERFETDFIHDRDLPDSPSNNHE